MSRQANVSLHQHSQWLPTGHLPCQSGFPKHPERLHDLKSISVWEFITMRPQPLSQAFVSATLALRELLSIFWRESGIHASHPSQVLSPADGQLPLLFHRLPVRLSGAFPSWMLPPCTAVVCLCLLQLPSAQVYITQDTGGPFFSLFWHYRNRL